MDNHRRCLISFFLLVLVMPSTMLVARQAQRAYPEYGVYDTDRLPPSFFKSNRERLMKLMGDSTAIVLFAAPERTRNNDVGYRYRQESSFYYFTGCDEPDAALILATNGIRYTDSTGNHTVHEILFVRPKAHSAERWTGKRMGPEGAETMLGIEHAARDDEFSDVVGRVFRDRKLVYLRKHDQEEGGELGKMVSAMDELARAMETWVEIRTPDRLINGMRAVKTAGEIALIRKAVGMSVEGHKRMMRACREGKHEFDLQAEFESAITSRGAEYVAYPCIVGSGENSVILHYESNRKELRNGEVVVADCGAEYHNYASDITRTFPVSGSFSKAQREVYTIVLRAQRAAIAAMKPGVNYFPTVTQVADSVIRDGLLNLGIIHDSLRYKNYFIHGLGHPVGLDVHDVLERSPLREGEVWTVEPGIYIPAGDTTVDQRYWNIGVRIEDDVLVTREGHEVLSADLPGDPDAVEKLMRSSGR